MSKESEPVSSRAGAGDSLVNLAHYLFPITPCNTVLAFFQRPRSSQPKFDFTFLEKMKKVYLKNSSQTFSSTTIHVFFLYIQTVYVDIIR